MQTIMIIIIIHNVHLVSGCHLFTVMCKFWLNILSQLIMSLKKLTTTSNIEIFFDKNKRYSFIQIDGVHW